MDRFPRFLSSLLITSDSQLGEFCLSFPYAFLEMPTSANVGFILDGAKEMKAGGPYRPLRIWSWPPGTSISSRKTPA
jgi:hypothetical protein